ncbi:flavin reductase family protein [Rudaeicoccus suwonensis]|uniref:Flavin reductase (DIM6/NTAB) family NADH-FMN oxidoreductase RutF n=1 Tax=Rudaeicoccus suwonensis TaxID=657409 RepID=A0A561E121_9MICO|nr:flavin reductase family protein [Rudaeicoccus suwonensis]TWE09336.1 flavin reductase (DIM6/NTAB) family NADH-FMN oxidoreductase RutF [Rudaeicoccus suwonensis]
MTVDPTPEVDSDEYRQMMGRLVTGVSVVTTRVGEVDHAMTVNALMSVSLEPVLMAVSIEREARFHDAVVAAGVWGMSILPDTARGAAAWLATRGRPLHGQLARIPHHDGPLTGMPLIDGALGTAECRTVNTVPAGDHTLLIGHVLSVAISEHPGSALVYYRGDFGVQR